MNVLRGLGFVWIALMFSGYSLAASTSTSVTNTGADRRLKRFD